MDEFVLHNGESYGADLSEKEMINHDVFRLAAEVMPDKVMPTTPEELAEFVRIVTAAERKRCAADVYNALLEVGQPEGIRKVAVDAVLFGVIDP